MSLTRLDLGLVVKDKLYELPCVHAIKDLLMAIKKALV